MKLFSGVISITGTSFLMFSVFSVTFVGFLLGRITIKGVSLGTAGVFIISLLYGGLFSSHISSTISQTVNGKAVDISSNALNIVENIGLIFFIGSVGHISGPTFFTNLKKNFKSYIVIGVIIILVSALTCVACFYIGQSHEKDRDEFIAMLVGVLSGALTSTPAFSAAKATAEKKYESAVTVGHAIAYIYGVVGVVLFIQIVPKIIGADMEHERALLLAEHQKVKDDNQIESSNTEQNGDTEHHSNGKNDEKPNEKEKVKDDEDEKEHRNGKLILAPIVTKEVIKENNCLVSSYSRKETPQKDCEKISDEKEVKREEKNDEEQEKVDEKSNEEKNEASFKLDSFGFCVFGFSAIIGIFVGAIKIPLSSKGLDGTTFSFTTTGGVLILSLIIAHFGRICQLSLKIDKKVLETLRELGLILFLAGSGISGGSKFVEHFKGIYFAYGIFMTTLPMIAGFFFSKYVLKLNLLNNLGSITGGMTSTPALGILISTSGTDDVAGSYAATYPIALICVVLSSQFIILLL